MTHSHSYEMSHMWGMSHTSECLQSIFTYHSFIVHFHTAPEAGFDPCTPLWFNLYLYLEQNGYFWLVPEHAQVLAARSFLVVGFDTHVIPRGFSCGWLIAHSHIWLIHCAFSHITHSLCILTYDSFVRPWRILTYGSFVVHFHVWLIAHSHISLIHCVFLDMTHSLCILTYDSFVRPWRILTYGSFVVHFHIRLIAHFHLWLIHCAFW